MKNKTLEKTLIEIIRVAELTNSLAEVARAAGLDPAIDFMHADFSGIDFKGIDLRGVDFRHAKREGASFAGAINVQDAIPAEQQSADLASDDLPEITLRHMLAAGVHIGKKRKFRHPRMKEYIFGERAGYDIFDLLVTRDVLARSLLYLSNLAQNGGSVLFVSRPEKFKDGTREAALRCGQHYVNERWLGGFLTNWKTIRPQIKRLEEGRIGCGWTTKKEMVLKQRALSKAERKYGGALGMKRPPDVLISLDAYRDENAIKEAKATGATVIAVADSNAENVEKVDFLIPGNSLAQRSNLLFLDAFSAAVIHGSLKAA